jgi:hypothetical protein
MSIKARVIVVAASLTVLGGCYENLEPEPQTAAPPPQQPVATESSTPGIGNTPRPGLSGAKRAAHNTVDQLEQQQRRLEEQMEEDQ